MGSTHPNPSVHIEHFMSSVRDYEDLNTALPLPKTLQVLSPMPEGDRWVLILHAMMLRKYFVSDERSTERLRLSEVARSLRACARGDALTHNWDLIIANIALLEPSMEYARDGNIRSEHDVVFDHLYGRYLHGDYDKWQRTGTPGDEDLPLWMATKNRAARLMMVAQLVRLLQRDGVLDP